MVAGLSPEALLELLPTAARIEQAIVGAALSAALGQGKASVSPDREFGLLEAAAALGRSERWLRAHRRELRIGYQLNGRGSWRFSMRELDLVRESAGRRGRP